MNVKNLLFSIGLVLFGCYASEAQALRSDYYSISNKTIQKSKFENISSNLDFVREDFDNQDSYSFGFSKMVANLIPILVDGASKLFYNPDNFNKEYFATCSLFDSSGRFNSLDPKSKLVFSRIGMDEKKKKQVLNSFEFAIGAVENAEGYYYMGLQSYTLNYSMAKLSSPKNRINYILDLSFYYFDGDDKAQEFHLNPILLDNRSVPFSEEIKQIQYQVIPKMKILQTVQLHVREVNASKQNWEKYLELYQSNQGAISNFLIRAVNRK
ncbi:hypothetical protein [Maribacter sp. R77961]|uniref:hypothetical protein n=1 Tax=Maribacter sp. R77961 TaxID=3093871 RepID=UPI0037C96228